MKRTCSLFLTLALALTLAACGSPAGQSGDSSSSTPKATPSASNTPKATPASHQSDSAPVESDEPTETNGGETKILIACFSATHNTENIANHLNDILDADLYEIVPETPYTADDLTLPAVPARR